MKRSCKTTLFSVLLLTPTVYGCTPSDDVPNDPDATVVALDAMVADTNAGYVDAAGVDAAGVDATSVDAAVAPGLYTIRWTGDVARIRDGLSNNVPMPGIVLGETFEAEVTYDPSGFGPGVLESPYPDVASMTFQAPVGLTMTFHFLTSNSMFTKTIDHVEVVYDGELGNFWYWRESQQNTPHMTFSEVDALGFSFGPSLPTSFVDMNLIMFSAQGNFFPTGYLAFDNGDSASDRVVTFSQQASEMAEN